MVFLIDWQWIWIKDYFEDIKSRKSARILMKIHQIFIFSKSFLVSISFQYQLKIIRFIQLKKEHINFLFVAVISFPLSIQMNILTLYDNCYVILTKHMLDSVLKNSDNLSKNLLLLPLIQKLMLDMVNYSTPLYVFCT